MSYSNTTSNHTISLREAINLHRDNIVGEENVRKRTALFDPRCFFCSRINDQSIRRYDIVFTKS
jgi:hypothetical protein